MQEEVDQKTIALSMKTGKFTAQVLQAALKKYLQHRAKGKTMLHHGQQSLKQLKKHGAALSNIEITEANIGAFKPCAKKYGVDFALRKDKTTLPSHYVVIFKSKDADNQLFQVHEIQSVRLHPLGKGRAKAGKYPDCQHQGRGRKISGGFLGQVGTAVLHGPDRLHLV